MTLIIEGIVTTIGPGGDVNFAPMGVEWDEEQIVLKPFLETTTFRNLSGGGAAVFNLVDDVMLFAQAVTGPVAFPSRPATQVRGVVLEAACSWRELEVRSVDSTPPRSRIVARVVARGDGKEFLGFNRAKHAVLEAAILATRTHMLPAADIQAELARLAVLVQKTAGPREQEAWDLIGSYIASRIGSSAA